MLKLRISMFAEPTEQAFAVDADRRGVEVTPIVGEHSHAGGNDIRDIRGSRPMRKPVSRRPGAQHHLDVDVGQRRRLEPSAIVASGMKNGDWI
jgi:hypothetical protein